MPAQQRATIVPGSLQRLACAAGLALLPARHRATTASAGVLERCDCNQPSARFEDQMPADRPRDALDFVVLLELPRAGCAATGFAVAHDRSATAAHFVEAARVDDAGRTPIIVDGHNCRARVLVHGDSKAPHGDWAIPRLRQAALDLHRRHPWPRPGSRVAIARRLET